MRTIWKEAAREVWDALAHTTAAILGRKVRDTTGYRQYVWRGTFYTIEKD